MKPPKAPRWNAAIRSAMTGVVPIRSINLTTGAPLPIQVPDLNCPGVSAMHARGSGSVRPCNTPIHATLCGRIELQR